MNQLDRVTLGCVSEAQRINADDFAALTPAWRDPLRRVHACRRMMGDGALKMAELKPAGPWVGVHADNGVETIGPPGPSLTLAHEATTMRDLTQMERKGSDWRTSADKSAQ